MTNNRVYDIKIAIERLKKYCSIQDRCQQDVIKKIKNWGLTKNSQDYILEILIQESYIDELRYTKSFCRGKFNIKKWGRNKIKYELKKKIIEWIFLNISKRANNIKKIKKDEKIIILNVEESKSKIW